MVVMSACKDDDSPVLEPQPEDLTPFAMTYVDFITPDDVQILSADTTRISVSSAYAEKMGIKFFKDRANKLFVHDSSIEIEISVVFCSAVQNCLT